MTRYAFYAGIVTLAALGGALAGTLSTPQEYMRTSAMLSMAGMTKDAGAESYIFGRMTACTQENPSGTCYQKTAEDFLNRFTLDEILKVLERNTANPAFQYCHEAAHYLGRAAYAHNSDNVARTLAQCTPACFGGCYHGALEAHFIKQNISAAAQDADDIGLAEEMPHFCGVKSDHKRTEDFNQCLHGLGHALMFLTENDLPRALKLCDALPLPYDQNWCWSGVFMENSTSATNKDHPSRYLKENEPLYPCTALEPKYLGSCYTLQSFYLAEYVGYDWEQAMGICAGLREEHQQWCFDGIGQSIAQSKTPPDHEETRRACGFAAADRQRQACIKGAAMALASTYGGDPSPIAALCATAATETKEHCYRAMGTALRNWLTDNLTLHSLCSAVSEAHYREFCERPD